MVYDTLTYHPTLTKLIRFLDTAAGREKLLRLVQYLCRFLSYRLAQSVSIETLTVIKRIQGVVTLDRKALRFLKPLNHLTLASKLYDNELSDSYVRLGSVLKNLGFAVYLSLDSIQWFKLLGIVSAKRYPKLARTASSFWFLALVGSLVGNLRNYQIENTRISENEDEVKKSSLVKLNVVKKNIVKDVLDAFVALNGAGVLGYDEGKIGLAGLITSVMGVQELWEKA